MGVGRFFCVALPFALTVGSIIFLLVATLAGVTDKSLYVFRIDVENLSIDPANVTNIVDNLSSRDLNIHDLQDRTNLKTDNITASDLNLAKYYDVSIWGYCSVSSKGNRNCTKPEFNWAASTLNTTTIERMGSSIGVKIELPKELKNSLNAFIQFSKWTQVAYIIAFVALAAEVVLGIFANCSRIVSCCTWIIAGIATALVCAAAVLSTVMGSVVVASIKATAKYYGATGKLNTTFLGIVWIAVAFAIGASLFWLFTICCCKPEHKSRKNRRSDGEKLLPTGGSGYAPIGNDHEMTSGNYYNQNQSHSQYGAPRYPSGAPRSDLAYEPYSHRA